MCASSDEQGLRDGGLRAARLEPLAASSPLALPAAQLLLIEAQKSEKSDFTDSPDKRAVRGSGRGDRP